MPWRSRSQAGRVVSLVESLHKSISRFRVPDRRTFATHQTARGRAGLKSAARNTEAGNGKEHVGTCAHSRRWKWSSSRVTAGDGARARRGEQERESAEHGSAWPRERQTRRCTIGGAKGRRLLDRPIAARESRPYGKRTHRRRRDVEPAGGVFVINADPRPNTRGRPERTTPTRRDSWVGRACRQVPFTVLLFPADSARSTRLRSFLVQATPSDTTA